MPYWYSSVVAIPKVTWLVHYLTRCRCSYRCQISESTTRPSASSLYHVVYHKMRTLLFEPSHQLFSDVAARLRRYYSCAVRWWAVGAGDDFAAVAEFWRDNFGQVATCRSCSGKNDDLIIATSWSVSTSTRFFNMIDATCFHRRFFFSVVVVSGQVTTGTTPYSHSHR